jgi:hypothetical protein
MQGKGRTVETRRGKGCVKGRFGGLMIAGTFRDVRRSQRCFYGTRRSVSKDRNCITVRGFPAWFNGLSEAIQSAGA